MNKKAKKILKKFGTFFRRVKKMGFRKGICCAFSMAAYRYLGDFMITFIKRFMPHVKKNRVVFESRPDFSDNARILSDYMIEHGYNKKYQIVWLVAEPEKYKQYRTKNVKFVRKFGRYHRKRTLAAYYYVLKSRYIFFTHAMRWVELKRPDQLYINLWHGCGYKDARGEEGATNVFDYCMVPGDVFVKTKAKFFQCDEKKILPLGYPRYNQFKEDVPGVQTLFSNYNSDAVKNIIWMPTFRDSGQLLEYQNPMPFIIGLPMIHSVDDFRRLDEICQQNKVNLIIKWHRNSGSVKNLERLAENIFFLTNEQLDELNIPLYGMMAQTDALITDYSSAAIDYILLDKPIGFTLDDYEDYKRTRGFVFEDAKEYMPGHHMYNMDDVAGFIRDVAEGRDPYAQVRKDVLKKTHRPTEDYCLRILDRFKIVK